jgi:hypothetical protein
MSIVEKVRDSASGEIFEIRREICGHCGNPIPLNGGGHAACLRAVKEQDSIEHARQLQKFDLETFGEVMPNDQIRQMRLHPDTLIDTTTKLTWNQMLAKKEAERKQAYYDRRAARQDRKERQLPDAIRRLKIVGRTSSS